MKEQDKPLGADAAAVDTAGSSESDQLSHVGHVDTDGASFDVVLAEVYRCAATWEGKARLLGNVRAEDICRAIAKARERETELRNLYQSYFAAEKDAQRWTLIEALRKILVAWDSESSTIVRSRPLVIAIREARTVLTELGSATPATQEHADPTRRSEA
jgi:hypothetical protein